MNSRLSRFPFWGWLTLLTVLCYAVWNPWGNSISKMMIGDAELSTKLLVGVVLVIVFGIFINATYRALGKVGLSLYLIFLGAIFYFLIDHQILDPNNLSAIKYVAPFLIALLLAIGSQGAKIYRSITGRVAVEDPDTNPDDHDHH